MKSTRKMKVPEDVAPLPATMPPSLKGTVLKPFERAVLQAIKEAGDKASKRAIKLAFWDDIREGFSIDDLDKRCFSTEKHDRNLRLSFCALWLLDSKDPRFELVDKVIQKVREAIRESPEKLEWSAEEISVFIDASVERVAEALAYVRELDLNFGGQHTEDNFGWKNMVLSAEGWDLDFFIRYQSLEELLEQYWQLRAPGRPFLNVSPVGGGIVAATEMGVKDSEETQAAYFYRPKESYVEGGGKLAHFKRGFQKAFFEQLILNTTLVEPEISYLIKRYGIGNDAAKAARDLTRKFQDAGLDLKVRGLGGSYHLSETVRIIYFK
jgi:hypothetical protein